MIIGFCVAVASPIERNFNRRRASDGYPLSWYPMFSGLRTNTLKTKYMYGLGEDGRHYMIPYTHWARGGFNQGRTQLGDAIRAGRKASMRKCEKVAQRLAKRKRGWRSRVKTVRVAKGRFDVERFFIDGQREPEREFVVAECTVNREPPAEEAKP